MTSTEPRTEQASDKVSLPTLTAMVVGSMIGSGVFLLPRRFGTATGVLRAIIAWTIAGTGMLMLAFVFQRLATRKPDLDAGIFAYAKAGFGDYVGFNSAIGYWASACAGNTSYWVLITATLSALVPGFGAGDTVLAVVVSAIGVPSSRSRPTSWPTTSGVLVVLGVGPGNGHDAHHRFRVPGNLGRERLLADGTQARGRRRHRVSQRTQRFRDGDIGVVWRDASGRNWPTSASPRWRPCWNPLSGSGDRYSSASV